MPVPERAAPPSSVLFSALLFVGTFAFFATCLPQRLYGDDLWFVYCILSDYPFTAHFLYIPLAKGATWLGAQAGVDPLLILRLLAASGSALGAALLFAAARRRGAATTSALLFALFSVTTASALFFATAAEIHGVHLGAAGLVVWCLARLDPTTSVRRVFALGLAFGVLVGTHKSGVLLLPGLAGLYLCVTRGRPARTRARDAAAVGAAGALSIATMVFCTWWQKRGSAAGGGSMLDGSDSLDFYIDGIRGRFAQGFSWRDWVEYVSIDAIAPALALSLVGAFGLGALMRQRRALALALLSLALPYLAFFPLFHFFERGAYFVVLLPLLAGVTVFHLGAPPTDRARTHSYPGAVVFALALAAAVWRPDEHIDILGALLPFGLVAAAFAIGLAAPHSPFAVRTTRFVLAAVLLLQLTGALRTLRDFDREQPTLAWARGAAAETAGAEAIIFTFGFERTLMFMVLTTPWPKPYAGTWSFAEALPEPMPTSFYYGDPTLSEAEFESQLAGHLAAGTRIYIDDEVTAVVRENPAIAGRLEHVERRYVLTPVRRDGFSARRVTLAP